MLAERSLENTKLNVDFLASLEEIRKNCGLRLNQLFSHRIYRNLLSQDRGLSRHLYLNSNNWKNIHGICFGH
jgi:hypothetical protein